MILVPDIYKKKKRILGGNRIATISPSECLIRLDSIEYIREDGRYFINRMTHFGNLYGYRFSIRDFLVSKTDLESGKVESIESSVGNNYDGSRIEELPENYIDIDGKKYFSCLNKNVYNMEKLVGFDIRKGKLEDNVYLPIAGNLFEDNFNMEYSRGVGNLAALATAAQLSIPFRCDIIIDNTSGYNITNMTQLIKDSDVQTIFKKEFKSFCNSIRLISDSICSDYKKGKETGDYVDHMRIYCGIREFDSFIKCVNIDVNNFELLFHFNNSDHLRTLLTTMSHLGEDFIFEESFKDLIDMNCLLTADSMFDSEYLRSNFETAKEPMNYIASYKDE